MAGKETGDEVGGIDALPWTMCDAGQCLRPPSINTRAI